MACNSCGTPVPSELQLEQERVAGDVKELVFLLAEVLVGHRIDPQDLDEVTRLLCERLKNAGDVSAYSPELQCWWIMHQAADRRREEADK